MIRPSSVAAALFWVAATVTLLHDQAGRDNAALLAFTATIAAGLVWLHERGAETRMSKPNKRRFKLEQVRAKVAEEKGGSAIEIEAPNGEVFTFPAPTFWSDELLAVAAERDVVKLATELLGGEAEYARFRTAGGQASDVALVMSEFSKEQGASEGESTASSAS